MPRKKRQWLIIDTVLMGVVGALSAQLFMILLKAAQEIFLGRIAGYRPPILPGEGGSLEQLIGAHGLWLIPLSTALGGLISGILVSSLAPEAEGHGTDTVVRAFHRTGGYLRSQVAPVKMIASAAVIGSGGAAGREGPTALISAGIGSIYAKVFRRSEQERRLLAIIGMAAGLSAIFRSPIGTALFAIEVLYSDMEFEADALFYTMLGSVVAYVVNGLFVGWEPIFEMPGRLSPPGATGYLWYALLGVGSGVVAAILPLTFYGLRDAFRKLPVPMFLKPAIGGFGLGLLALALPQVLGGGYGWIQEAINGTLPLKILISLVFVKILAFSFSVSSGGSGGVFAPCLFVGAMVGGAMAKIFDEPSAAFAVVGMAAVFGGTARVPIATLLMVTEMTGGYQLLVPAGLAVMISYFIQSGLTERVKYRSLYEEQVSNRAASPAHHVDQLRIALDLLDKRRITSPAVIGHLNLLALLESGVMVDLADGKQLMIGVLNRESPWNGRPVSSSYRKELEGAMEIVAVLRENEVLLPNPDTTLKAGDRILLVASPEAKKNLSEHLAPLSEQRSEEGGPRPFPR